MTLRTWFKKIKKKLDFSRKELYYDTLANRYITTYSNIAKDIKEYLLFYPEYVKDSLLNQLSLSNLRIVGMGFRYLFDEKRNVDRFKKYMKELRHVEKDIKHKIDDINKTISRFSQERKPVDFDNVRFVLIENCLKGMYFGYVAHYQDRGNGEDYNIWGRFYDYSNGNDVELTSIDKTFIIKPINRDGLINRFLNLYQATLNKHTLTIQIGETMILNDAWNIQKTYLKQQNIYEEGNM